MSDHQERAAVDDVHHIPQGTHLLTNAHPARPTSIRFLGRPSLFQVVQPSVLKLCKLAEVFPFVTSIDDVFLPFAVTHAVIVTFVRFPLVQRTFLAPF